MDASAWLQLFEYAHVLMFTIAVVYAKEIAILSIKLGGISDDFVAADALHDQAVLSLEREWWVGGIRTPGVKGTLLRWWRASLLNPRMYQIMSQSTFKVLRFHFMVSAGLLGKAKFEFAAYVTRSMEKHVHEIIEITPQSWILFGGVVAVSIPFDFTPRHSIYAWVCVGWLLLLLEMVLLWRSQAILGRLICEGHRLRLLACEEHAPSASLSTCASSQDEAAAAKPPTREARGQPVAPSIQFAAAPAPAEASSPRVPPERRRRIHVSEVRMRELSAAVQTAKTPSLASQLVADMKRMQDQEKREPGGRPPTPRSAEMRDGDEDVTADEIDHSAQPRQYQRTGGGVELQLLPHAIQLTMILQCTLQALIITLIGRDAVVLFSAGAGDAVQPKARADLTGCFRGIGLILSMVAPTIIMSMRVTPRVVKNFALAYAAAHRQPDVLEELETEYMQSGDYAAANQALELAADTKLSAEDLLHSDVVRAKVGDLAKLGEMRWRYRVVDHGQNPRDEAIKVLDEARELIEEHIRLEVAQQRSAAPLEERTQQYRKRWARELSDVCQGLALARLVHNGNDRAEDTTISTLLKEALSLREETRQNDKIAETLNSLGALRQKQRAFKDAEAYYQKSLGMRQRIRVDPSAKEGHVSSVQGKAQAVAQSLTSLGNLYVEMGDSEGVLESAAAESGGWETKQTETAHRRAKLKLYEQALQTLKDAKEQYIKGFSQSHPKVAWALEGIARVYQKHAMFREAQVTWEEAIQIRNQLQESSTGKQLFSSELERAMQSKAEIEEMRSQVRSRFKNTHRKLSLTVPGKSFREPLLGGSPSVSPEGSRAGGEASAWSGRLATDI